MCACVCVRVCTRARACVLVSDSVPPFCACCFSLCRSTHVRCWCVRVCVCTRARVCMLVSDFVPPFCACCLILCVFIDSGEVL